MILNSVTSAPKPNKTEGRDPGWAGVRHKPLCCFSVPPRSQSLSGILRTIIKELHMKRIIVALVLALGVATVVGCSGGSTTTPTKAK